MWNHRLIAETVSQGLCRQARQEDAEQAVYGLDALDELGLHPRIHRALREAGWGVLTEQPYPSDRLVHSRKSQAQRCDVVLTPAPGLALRDPQARGTLFAHTDSIDPEQAYWLEIKTVAQFEITGPFRRYSSELLSSVTRDIKKLWQEPHICFAGLLIVLFTADKTIAQHDLAVWEARCLQRGYPVQPGIIRGFPLTDRIGNTWCATALYPVRG